MIVYNVCSVKSGDSLYLRILRHWKVPEYGIAILYLFEGARFLMELESPLSACK